MASSMVGAGGNTRPGSVESSGGTVVMVSDTNPKTSTEDTGGIQFHGKETPQYPRSSSSAGQAGSPSATTAETATSEDRPVSRRSIRLDVAEEKFRESEEMRRSSSAGSNTSSKSRENPISPGRHDDDHDVVIPKQETSNVEEDPGNFIKSEAANMRTINEETRSQVSRENSRPASAILAKKNGEAFENQNLLVENDMRLESVTPSNSTVPQPGESVEQKFLSSSPSPVIATEVQSASRGDSCQPMSVDSSLNSSMEVDAARVSSSGSLETSSVAAAKLFDGVDATGQQNSRPLSAKSDATLQGESSRPVSAQSAKTISKDGPSFEGTLNHPREQENSRPGSAQATKTNAEVIVASRPISATSVVSEKAYRDEIQQALGSSRPESAVSAKPNEKPIDWQPVTFFNNGTISIAMIPVEMYASRPAYDKYEQPVSAASPGFHTTELESESKLGMSRPASARTPSSQAKDLDPADDSSTPVSTLLAKTVAIPSRPVSSTSATSKAEDNSSIEPNPAIRPASVTEEILQKKTTESRPLSGSSVTDESLNQGPFCTRPVSAKSVAGEINGNGEEKGSLSRLAFDAEEVDTAGSRPFSAKSAASETGKLLLQETADSRPASAKSQGSAVPDTQLDRPASGSSARMEPTAVEQTLDTSRPTSAKSTTLELQKLDANTSRPTSAKLSQLTAAEDGSSRPDSVTSSKLDILHVTEVPSLSSRHHSAKAEDTNELSGERPLSAKSTISIRSHHSEADKISPAPEANAEQKSRPISSTETENVEDSDKMADTFKVAEDEVDLSNPPSALQILAEEPINVTINERNAMESAVDTSVPPSPDYLEPTAEEESHVVNQAALEADYYSLILSASTESPSAISERLQRFSFSEQPADDNLENQRSDVVMPEDAEGEEKEKAGPPDATSQSSAAEAAEVDVEVASPEAEVIKDNPSAQDVLVTGTTSKASGKSQEELEEAELSADGASASMDGSGSLIAEAYCLEPADDKVPNAGSEGAGRGERSSRVSLRADSPGRGKQDHDSGVDENTQAGSDGAANIKKASAAKEGRAPARKITSRSTSRSKSLTKEEEPLKEVKKVPMNKIQVGGGPSPNLKAVKSKIGSLGNTGYKPGGGNVRIEHKKVEIGEVKPKVGAKNEAYQGPAGGQKKKTAASATPAAATAAAEPAVAEEKSAPPTATLAKSASKKVITSHKLNWNAKSKIGSLENKDYKPKGGDKKIETVKLNFKGKAQSKVASTANLKHKPGGGDVKNTAKAEEEKPDETEPVAEEKPDIETLKLDFKAESKIGSLDNVRHRPGGGDKQIFEDKEYLRQMSKCGSKIGSSVGSSAQGSRSLLQTPEPAQNGSSGDKENNGEAENAQEEEEQAGNDEEAEDVGESMEETGDADNIEENEVADDNAEDEEQEKQPVEE